MTLDELLDLNPFPGLRPFRPGEADRFFGRRRQIDDLVDLLEEKTFIAVAGASGCGKSSLVLAGMLHELEVRHAKGSAVEWRPVVVRPGNHPIGNLAGPLSAVLGGSAGDDATRGSALEGRLRLSGIGLAEAVGRARLPPHVRVLVVVDQFEEIFRFRRMTDTEDAAAFVKLLLHSAQDPESPVSVIVTLRSDTLGYCADFRDLPEAISRGQYLVPRLTREQRKEAIVGPVELRGFAIAPRLVQRVLNDVSDDFDDLPVMQHALTRTWRHWAAACQGARPIDLENYTAIGTTAHALSLHADEAYESLTGLETVVGKVFCALTERIDDVTEIRRPMDFKQLCAVTAASEEDVARVIERYRRADTVFLLPPPPIPLATNPVIDISHESLIRNWRRLKQWANLEAQSAQVYRRLAGAAALFAKGEEGLLRDPGLQFALDWREQSRPNAAWAVLYAPDFERTMAFLDESRDAREQERIAVERKAMHRRYIAGAVALSVLVVAGVLVKLAVDRADGQRKVAELAMKANKVAQARQLVVQANTDLDTGRLDRALWLTVAAMEVEPAEAQDTLRLALQDAPRQFLWGHDARVSSVAFSPDGRSLATASVDGTVILWDPVKGTPRERLTRDSGEDRRDSIVAYARDGTLVATPGVDGTVIVENEASGVRRVPLEGKSVGAPIVTTNPDRTLFASSDGDNTFRVWDMRTGRILAAAKTTAQQITSMAVSPDGGTVALGTAESTVLLWDLAKGRLRRILNGHSGAVRTVAFSPDGTRLGSGGDDGTAVLWDVRSGKQKGTTLAAHQDRITTITFSPDGASLATAGGDNAVIVWDVVTGKRKGGGWKRSHQDVVTTLAFSVDSQTLASGSVDQTIIVWNVAQGKPVGRPLKGHSGPVTSIAFSPDGNILASTGWDKAVILWNVGTQRALRGVLKDGDESVTQVAFSPDGRLLATANEDSNVSLWHVLGAEPRQSRLSGHSMQVTTVAFSPDGAILASGSEDTSVLLWDVASGERAGELAGHANKVTSVAFSPDGKTLASGSWDKTVMLWDVAQRKLRQPPLEGHRSQVTSVAYSSNGKVLASASADGTIRLWDAATGAPVGTPLTGHRGWVTGIAFSPDGTRLASVGMDGLVKLWDGTDGRPLEGNEMSHTRAVWGVAFRPPDGKVLATAGIDGVFKLWDVARRTLIAQPLAGHDDTIWSIAFSSPDGRTLATGSADRTVILWDADVAGWTQRACAIAGRDIALEEWPKHVDASLKGKPVCR